MGVSDRRLRESGGVALMALGLLLLLALLSYRPDDPSFSASGTAPAVKNLIGRFGSYTADRLFLFLGVTAYGLPLLACGWGLHLIRASEGQDVRRRLVGQYLVWLAAAGLANLWLPAVPTVAGGAIQRGAAGGLAGLGLSVALQTVFAGWGAMILLLVILLVGVLFSSRDPLATTAQRLVARLSPLVQRLSARLPLRRLPRLSGSSASRRLKAARPRIHEAAQPSPDRARTRAQPPIQPPFPQEVLEFMKAPAPSEAYRLPPLDLLTDPPTDRVRVAKEELVERSDMLEKRLREFGIVGRVAQVSPGPVVTMYELELAPGVKVSRIIALTDDLALAMRTAGVRVVAPIPGRATVGVEIPNSTREEVYLKEILTSEAFSGSRARLPLALGKDIYGTPVVADLATMPHLLIAGSTGSGKSMAINTMILSLLFRHTPEEVKFLLIDPKVLELTAYQGLPYLLHPIVTEPKAARQALARMVAEMERRYRLMAEAGVRSIETYNKPVAPVATYSDTRNVGRPSADRPSLPYLVVVMDDLADFMMVAPREVEDSIARLAQMGRAAGIHLIVATQRPSVDVLTGTIKVNFPARISFKVASKVDSRTIIDAIGADQLIGRGDMLFLAPGTARLARLHGGFVGEEEAQRVVRFAVAQAAPVHPLSPTTLPPLPPEPEAGRDERDELYQKAVDLVTTTRQASASFIQRRLRVGYPRAARMVEMMEEDGIVGPAIGARPREILNEHPTRTVRDHVSEGGPE